MKRYLLAVLVLVSCNRKATTEITTSTRDSIATVTLPTRSTSIISQPCDSLGLRPFEIVQVVGKDTIKLIGYRDRIVTEYITIGDTSSKVSKSETSKSTTTKIIYKTSQFDWWLRIIAAVYIVWLVSRKRIFNILNNG